MASQEFQEDASKQLKMVQYPLDSNSYQILSKIGHGSSAVVYKAICLPVNSSVVAIKAIDLDRSKADLDSVRRETKIMSLLYHPNILRAHCSFTVERSLWVVMPFMSGGSLQSIITTAYPDGLLETCIAIILKEILCALAYLHDNGHLHRDVKAGNILIDSAGSVKLADFGVSASLYESNSSNDSWASSSSSLMLRDVTGTPYWMAPEVIHSHVGYSFKADIWSFGITALELARGRPPLSHLPPSKSLIMNITKRFRLSDYENNQKSKNKKFSKSFKEMVGSCLDQDPSKRPSAEKLLKHPFFRGCKGPEFLVKNMLQGLPSVEQRFIEAKHRTPVPLIRTEEDDDEEPLPGEIVKQRRISGWNFNEDGLELEPVFPPDDEVKGLPKEECFGGEKCILEMIDSSGESISGSSVAAAENPQTGGGENQASEDAENSGGEAAENVSVGGGNREVVIRSLLVLKQSLDDQRQRVASMISLLRGEEIRSREDELNQVIENLRMELESERRKNFELETTLELLKKLHLSGE